MEDKDEKVEDEKEEEKKQDEEVEQPTQGKMDILLQGIAEINDKLSALLEKINAVAQTPTEEKSNDDKKEEDESEGDEEEKAVKKGDAKFVKVETPVVENEVEKKDEGIIGKILRGEMTVEEAEEVIKGGR